MSEFSKAAIVTTPHEVSQRIKDAQYLMQGHSVFGAGLSTYKDGKPDGDFGPLTAQAAARTKYWLGYAAGSQDPTFGQSLYNLLTGKTKLSSAQSRLRATRLTAQTPGQLALAYASTQLGITEDPRESNDQKYGVWFKFNGVAWCAIFESYCFAHSSKPYTKYHYASVEAIYYDAVANRNNLRIIYTPQAGDICCYSEGGIEFAHTAFWQKKLTDTTFQDLGGNTGPSNMSNGGAVLAQTRSTSLVKAYVRVG